MSKVFLVPVAVAAKLNTGNLASQFHTLCSFTSAFMASTSSTLPARSIVSPKMYDVFISHRGPDVKLTLAKQLYDFLEEKGCRAFLDREEIEGGESITAAIHNAICSSLVQIAIFSKGYAESKWCLDELLLMLQQTDALFIPVFYGVEPKELRSIDRGSYAAAFSYYQSKDKYQEKAEVWKNALTSAADISGYKDSVHKDNLCEWIVSRVVQVVKEKEESIPLHVADYPVGLDELVQDFERCCSNTEGLVGIFGLGGSGKTTMAKHLFNKKRSAYHKSCFLSDVKHSRANLQSLQKQLLKDLFDKDQEITSVDVGIGKLKYLLGRAKHLNFLLVLDDIDHENQINALLPEGMLGSGRRIIITTRDQNMLKDADDHYKMKEMDKNRAKELFCSHAFRVKGRRDPPPAFEKLVDNFEEFCGGLPLCLKVLGAHLYGRKEDYWKLELERVKNIQPKDIRERLKISFDGLNKEEKQIFIDIACIFNKKLKAYNLIRNAITIWNAANWSAELALRTLQDKCLLQIVDAGGYEIFEMHDHIRNLGRYIADEMCPLFPHELGPPRLWRPKVLRSMEGKGFKKILEETKGRCFHSFMDLSLRRKITFFIADTDLLWLEMSHHAESRDLISIPSWIPLRRLHILDVWDVKELWSCFQQQAKTTFQVTVELRKMEITNSLQRPPYLMEMFHLEELKIFDSLEKADITSLVQSLKQLSSLRSLELWHEGWTLRRTSHLRKGRDSINLDSCRSSCMKSLETIRLHGLQTISNIVISREMCPKLRSLVVSGLDLLNKMELKQLQSLHALRVNNCPELETVTGLSSLTGLQQMNVRGCPRLKSLPSLAHFRHLKKIRILQCPLLQGLQGLEELSGLKSLVIQMPDYGYTHGLRMPWAKKIILTQEVMGEALPKLNANLFSEVIGDEAVTEIQSGGRRPKIESSSSVITIYTLFVTTSTDCLIFEGKVFCRGRTNLLITFLLNQHDSQDRLYYLKVRKGFKVVVKVEEENKALIVLQRIVDRLYKHEKVPDL